MTPADLQNEGGECGWYAGGDERIRNVQTRIHGRIQGERGGQRRAQAAAPTMSHSPVREALKNTNRLRWPRMGAWAAALGSAPHVRLGAVPLVDQLRSHVIHLRTRGRTPMRADRADTRWMSDRRITGGSCALDSYATGNRDSMEASRTGRRWRDGPGRCAVAASGGVGAVLQRMSRVPLGAPVYHAPIPTHNYPIPTQSTHPHPPTRRTVPASSVSVCPSLTKTERPKSAAFRVAVSDESLMRKFSGLMSLRKMIKKIDK